MTRLHQSSLRNYFGGVGGYGGRRNPNDEELRDRIVSAFRLYLCKSVLIRG